MRRHLKFILIIIVVFSSLIVAFIVAVACYYYLGSDIDFDEENSISLTIPMEEDVSCELPVFFTSFVMDSPDDLLFYLHQRESSQSFDFLPFEGYLEIDSLDFDTYDYVFSEGYPILRMKKLLWDDCTFYESDSLTPVFFEMGERFSRKVYIYKIKPKNKYRVVCE